MDNPWGSIRLSEIVCPFQKFEDNFVSEGRLPDSKLYLETLEKKLEKLKRQGSTAKDLLRALSSAKESHLERIVDSNLAVILNDSEFDQPCTQSTFQRLIAPEKQANTINELYELIKYDQLGQLFEQLEKEESE